MAPWCRQGTSRALISSLAEGRAVRVFPVLRVLPVPLVLAACAVAPDPLSDADREARITADRAAIAEMAPVPETAIDLYEAMARAIAFNLKQRQQLLETAIAAGIADVASYDMLPRLVASAGLTHRSNESATVSRDLSTGALDNSHSTSSDRTLATSSLKLSWNVLDFGVSYLQARQNADRILIATEKRRKAIQTILRDVQSAWLRAVVAERLTRDLIPLIARVETAMERARIIEEQRLVAPMEALEVQRSLLGTLRMLQGLRRDLVGARADLARLINIPPGTPFDLAMPADLNATPDVRDTLSTLVERALRDRPELREEDYQARISANETYKAMVRMLPGLELSTGANWDSNSYVRNATWANAGMFLAWNLMNLVSGPSRIALAEQQEDLAQLRRLALHVAVAGQVAVAWEQLQVARDALELADQIHDVDERIYGHAVAGAETEVQSEIQVIRTEAARLASRVRRDMAYVEREEALAALRVSVGDDPLDALGAIGQDAPLGSIKDALTGWHHAVYAVDGSGPAFGTGGAPLPVEGVWTIETAPGHEAGTPEPKGEGGGKAPSTDPGAPLPVEGAWTIETTGEWSPPMLQTTEPLPFPDIPPMPPPPGRAEPDGDRGAVPARPSSAERGAPGGPVLLEESAAAGDPRAPFLEVGDFATRAQAEQTWVGLTAGHPDLVRRAAGLVRVVSADGQAVYRIRVWGTRDALDPARTVLAREGYPGTLFPPAPATVQLGAYPTDTEARDAWARLVRAHSSLEVQTRLIRPMTGETGGRFFALHIDGPPSDLDTLCARLREEGATCFMLDRI